MDSFALLFREIVGSHEADFATGFRLALLNLTAGGKAAAGSLGFRFRFALACTACWGPRFTKYEINFAISSSASWCLGSLQASLLRRGLKLSSVGVCGRTISAGIEESLSS